MKIRLLNFLRLPQDQRLQIEKSYHCRPQNWLKKLALLLTVLLMVMAGCWPQSDQVVQQFVDAVNNKDLNSAVRLFASDAMVDIGNSVYISSQQEIEQWLKDLFEDNLNLEKPYAKEHDGQIDARYTLTLNNASDLGVVSLSGTSEFSVRRSKITKLHFTLDIESQAKLLKAILIADSPRLTYAVLPDPSPLRANEGARIDDASFTVLITNLTDLPVDVKSITFILPEGSLAGDLTTDPTNIHTDNPNGENWVIGSEGGGRLRLAPRMDGGGHLDAGNGLSFTIFKIPVNAQPGSWELEIIEELWAGNGESINRSTTIQLFKLPPRFYVGDLNAEPLIINAGEETTLWWSGSESATYIIKYWDGTQEVSENVEGPVFKYPIKLQETTTFYLVAEARVLDKTVTLQRERTVTVIQAILTPTPAPTGSSTESLLNVAFDNEMVSGEIYANKLIIGSPR
jgi:hypothetical protein